MFYPHQKLHHLVLLSLTMSSLLVGCLSKPRSKVNLNQMASIEDPNDQNILDSRLIDMGEVDLGEPTEPIPCELGSAPKPCGELRPSVQGVCAEAQSYCLDGVWTSCEIESLQVDNRFSSFLGQERLDCYDNDCDGSVDEGVHGAPPISYWVTGNHDRPSAHCHYRPFNNEGEEVSEVTLLPEREHYKIGSLTVHSGMTLKIKKKLEWAEEEQTPGFMPLITATSDLLNCMKDNVGGQLILTAEQIHVESGGALRADSESSHCPTGDPNDLSKSINGASGGELILLARDLLIHGELSANGAPPQPQLFFSNLTYSTRISGGAAGSVFLNSPHLVLRGQVTTQGGLGQCESVIDAVLIDAVPTECPNGRSQYSGGGPGREGGRPYAPASSSGNEGGAGSGGRSYDSVDYGRTLGVIGLAAEVGPGTTLTPADGNGSCDGEIEYGPGTAHLFMAAISCAMADSSIDLSPNLNHVEYHHVFIPLDEDGVPVASNSIYMSVLNAGMTLASNSLEVGMIATRTSLSSGESYLISLSSDNEQDEDQIKSVKVIYADEGSSTGVQSVDVPIESIIENELEVRQGTYHFE
jgi:hypothetical protein